MNKKECIFCTGEDKKLDPRDDISMYAEMYKKHQYHNQNKELKHE